MTIKELKNYQEKAVNKLLSRTRELFEENIDKRTIVFQAPTGSGKTFMMSKYIEEIINTLEEKDICFLWLSIGKGDLHIQSYDSIKNVFQGFPVCNLLEKEFFGSKKEIEKNEVVVANWEKLRNKDGQTGEWKNILMKDKETVNFRELIRNTKESGKTIILIIDESHSNSTSERATELRDDIVNADLTIEMSATPTLKEGEYNEKVQVQPNDVIEEGMIKKEIIINENIDSIDDNEITSQELILEIAFKKREELKQIYLQENIKINPLVLIQLPSSEAGEDKREFVENFLSKKGIKYDNHKLAIWLSEEKVNNEKEFVTPNESNVEFLLFKQAIDTGWDCPRAQILVRFREIKSIVFEIQTVGRILRMPEAQHYKNDILNKGYVYTNVKSLEVKKETYNPNIIKSINVKRKKTYTSIKLKSYYRNRLDFGDVTLSFYNILEDTFCDFFNIEKDKKEFNITNKNKEVIKEKISVYGLDNQDEIILNKEIETNLFDQITDEKIKSDKTLKANLSQNDLFYAFENIIKINLQGFAPKRSISIIKQALYRWFKKYLNVNLHENGIIYVQNVVLNNAEIFSKLLDQSIKNYKPIKEEEIKNKIKELEEWQDEWEIVENRNYNPHTYKKYDYKLNIYEPCYLNLDNNLEKDFVEFLEKNKDKIEWWFQNGNEHMILNFGIKYNTKSTFQPDFIIKLKDGRIGIFDTKAVGEREDENKLKSEALQKYILEENKKNKCLFGGLVIKDNNKFRIYQEKEYIGFKENHKNWNFLEF
ncbi:MAG: DEAD/DEAH box helicase [Candidatus Woesearchaeota archaeon]